MSQENVEIWRANLEGQLAELTAGTSPEATISKLAEIWDPDIELDATESPVMDLKRVYRGPDEARQFWREWFAAWETCSECVERQKLLQMTPGPLYPDFKGPQRLRANF
jgi:hypothetical protein